MRQGNDRRRSSRGFNNRFGGGNKSGGGFNRGGGQGRFDRGPKELHKAICAECKRECQVPFKPTEGKPVYCRDCFQKHRPQRF